MITSSPVGMGHPHRAERISALYFTKAERKRIYRKSTLLFNVSSYVFRSFSRTCHPSRSQWNSNVSAPPPLSFPLHCRVFFYVTCFRNRIYTFLASFIDAIPRGGRGKRGGLKTNWSIHSKKTIFFRDDFLPTPVGESVMSVPAAIVETRILKFSRPQLFRQICLNVEWRCCCALPRSCSFYSLQDISKSLIFITPLPHVSVAVVN